MKCMLGFIMIWIGIGMLIKVFLPNTIWVFLLIGVLIAAGYCLFCDKRKRHRRFDKYFGSFRNMKKTDR